MQTMNRMGRWVAGFAAAVAIALPAPAQRATEPSEISIEARAGDAAVAVLIDRVLDLELASRRKLSTELASSPEGERLLRGALFVQAERTITTTGAGEVITARASISRADLAKLLTDVGERLTPLLSVERLKLPPGPPSIEGEASVRRSARLTETAPGWRHCTREQMELARAAAVVNLAQNLLLAVADVRAGDGTVGHLFPAHPVFREELARLIAKVPAGAPTYETNGYCRVAGTLTREQLLEMLGTAARAAGISLDTRSEEMLRTTPRTLAAEGFGTAPPTPPAVAR